MYKLIAFDLDGTLTQHRSKLGEANRKTLEALDKRYKLLMVGAGGCERIFAQLNGFPIDIIGYYGMQESVMDCGRPKILRSEFYTVDKDYFTEATDKVRAEFGYTDFKGAGVEFHETGAVTFPLLGKDADIADKVAFDPDRKKRAVMYPFVKSLFPGFNVFIGGSSSFDIVKERFNKYNALTEYMAAHNLSKDDVMYVGDDFGEGGNDEHVKLGGLNYTVIDDYTKLGLKLSFLLQ